MARADPCGDHRYIMSFTEVPMATARRSVVSRYTRSHISLDLVSSAIWKYSRRDRISLSCLAKRGLTLLQVILRDPNTALTESFHRNYLRRWVYATPCTDFWTRQCVSIVIDHPHHGGRADQASNSFCYGFFCFHGVTPFPLWPRSVAYSQFLLRKPLSFTDNATRG